MGQKIHNFELSYLCPECEDVCTGLPEIICNDKLFFSHFKCKVCGTEWSNTQNLIDISIKCNDTNHNDVLLIGNITINAVIE